MAERDNLSSKPRICPICLRANRFFHVNSSPADPCGSCQRTVQSGRAAEMMQFTVARLSAAGDADALVKGEGQ